MIEFLVPLKFGAQGECVTHPTLVLDLFQSLLFFFFNLMTVLFVNKLPPGLGSI